MAKLSRLVAATFSSHALLSSSVSTVNLSCSRYRPPHSNLKVSLQLIVVTSLQSFESDRALFLVVFCFLMFASYPQPFFPLVSVVLFTFKFLISKWTFLSSMLKLLECIVEMNNTGVTGQFLLPKNWLWACAYVIPPTHFRTRQTYWQHNIYHAKSRLDTPVRGSLRSPNYTNRPNYTRTMVPITGRARSFVLFLEFSKTK